jgi:hypothetical protein
MCHMRDDISHAQRGGVVNGFDRVDAALVCANGALPNLDLV